MLLHNTYGINNASLSDIATYFMFNANMSKEINDACHDIFNQSQIIHYFGPKKMTFWDFVCLSKPILELSKDIIMYNQFKNSFVKQMNQYPCLLDKTKGITLKIHNTEHTLLIFGSRIKYVEKIKYDNGELYKVDNERYKYINNTWTTKIDKNHCIYNQGMWISKVGFTYNAYIVTYLNIIRKIYTTVDMVDMFMLINKLDILNDVKILLRNIYYNKYK